MMSTHDSLTSWYTELQASEKRTFWACFGGWALDAMDVQIFSFAIPAIIAAFHLSNADAGLIGTVTLLTSAFGGWFAGALSDRFGRVRTLQITIVWFAFFTFLCGFAQSYAQLFAFRALMGLGFGGEWADLGWMGFRDADLHSEDPAVSGDHPIDRLGVRVAPLCHRLDLSVTYGQRTNGRSPRSRASHLALRRCCRADFLLGFRHYVADAFDRAGIKLLGLLVGDHSRFYEALG